MVVKPDHDTVDRLAAKVIAYRRLRTRKEGNELFTDKAMARAVREKVEEYEASKYFELPVVHSELLVVHSELPVVHSELLVVQRIN
jgi:hypothetical protein